jgi:hypothetical protein
MAGRSMLRHRWFFVAVVCLGIALGLPSLQLSFLADDYTFIQRLEDPEQQATFRLCEFATCRWRVPRISSSARSRGSF